MTWASPKGFRRMSSHPRSLSWIVVSVGGLAVFLIFASWVLLSYPIGASVHGYFYGVDSFEKLDVSVSPINETIIDVHLNRSLDIVDNNVSSDIQPPTTPSGLSIDKNIEQTHTISNSQVPFNESSSPKFPKTKEPNGLETSDAAASNNSDVFNSSLSVQSNLAGSLVEANGRTNSSNVTGDIRINEPVSVVLINKSSAISTTSNESSLSPDSLSKSVPASLDTPNNASFGGSVDSGWGCF